MLRTPTDCPVHRKIHRSDDPSNLSKFRDMVQSNKSLIRKVLVGQGDHLSSRFADWQVTERGKRFSHNALPKKARSGQSRQGQGALAVVGG
jgi:hypothetical protein